MKQRGAALVLALWLMAMLGTLVLGLALAGRTEALQSKVLADSAKGEETARAGVEYALAQMEDRDPRARWLSDGRMYLWNFDDARLEIRIVDEAGKVELNQADVALLSSLLRVAGAESNKAEQIASAIVDWRDSDGLSQASGGGEDAAYEAAGLPYGAKDAPFDTVAEVGRVLGMTPKLQAAIAPYLTVYSERAVPDPNVAPSLVLTAMGLDASAYEAKRQSQDVEGEPRQWAGVGSGTYSIESRAHLLNGHVAVLRVTVRVGGGPVPNSTYIALYQDSHSEFQ